MTGHHSLVLLFRMALPYENFDDLVLFENEPGSLFFPWGHHNPSDDSNPELDPPGAITSFYKA